MFFPLVRIVLIFCIAGLLFIVLRARRTLGAYRIPRETGLLIPSDYRGGLNRSTQHFLEVYSQESENLKSLAGVDLSAALLCSDPTGNSWLGLFSSGSIVV